ncbi:cytochrome-c peroxidase [Photobacterium sp. DNB22_13_2]
MNELEREKDRFLIHFLLIHDGWFCVDRLFLIIKKVGAFLMSKNTTRLTNAVGAKLSIPLVLGIMGASAFSSQAVAEDMTYMEELGKRLFFEKISINDNMSCATCHTGGTGGTNGDSHVNNTDVAVTGSDGVSVGNLKPPGNQYVQFLDDDGKIDGLKNFDLCDAGFALVPCGGAFWNGRARGDRIEVEHGVDVFAGLSSEYEEMYRKYLGPLADQAHASPFINPLEQAEPNKKAVCVQVRDQTEWGKQLFKFAWGKDLKCGKKHVNQTFAHFAVALSAWQMSSDNNRFDSKRDVSLAKTDLSDPNNIFNFEGFTEQENRGRALFYNPRPGVGARCFFCHASGPDQGTSKFERYTNDQYFNLGIPRNNDIPNPAVDDGVEITAAKFAFENNIPHTVGDHIGKHKVPTLRNVDKRPHSGFVKAYTHNGYFKTLEQLVHFYNTSLAKDRCEDIGVFDANVEEAIANNCWPKPEKDVNNLPPSNIVGDLKLSAEDEADLVAYMKTLSDESTVKAPSRYKLHIYDPKRLKHGDSDDKPYEEPKIEDPFAGKFSFGRF